MIDDTRTLPEQIAAAIREMRDRRWTFGEVAERSLASVYDEVIEKVLSFAPPVQPAVHEFTEDINDGSMCICGVPGLNHDAILAAAPPAQEAPSAVAEEVWPDDYGWDDLMTLLDAHWPGDIFGDTDLPLHGLRGETAHDAGVRIVALLRWVDHLASAAQEAPLRAAVEAQAEAWCEDHHAEDRGIRYRGCSGCTLRAVLDQTDEVR